MDWIELIMYFCACIVATLCVVTMLRAIHKASAPHTRYPWSETYIPAPDNEKRQDLYLDNAPKQMSAVHKHYSSMGTVLLNQAMKQLRQQDKGIRRLRKHIKRLQCEKAALLKPKGSCLDIPEGLSPEGKKAAEVILKTVNSKAGNTRVFFTPKEWKDRGEMFGEGSELIIMHDGNGMAPYFAHEYERYEMIGEMHKALKAENLYVEQCTSWYSAVYKIKNIC